MLTKHKELFPRCPKYAKQLKQCPGSRDILTSEDLQNLTHHCTDHYESCKIYSQSKERAA